MTEQKDNTKDLVARIDREVLESVLILNKPHDEQMIELEAARVVRSHAIDILGLKDKYVPSVNEIRSYAILYNRALELLKQDE